MCTVNSNQTALRVVGVCVIVASSDILPVERTHGDAGDRAKVVTGAGGHGRSFVFSSGPWRGHQQCEHQTCARIMERN